MSSPDQRIRRNLSQGSEAASAHDAHQARVDAPRVVRRTVIDFSSLRLPEDVRRQLRQFPREQRSDDLLEWYNPLKIKIVFAIRADRMSDLDGLKNHIPTVLHDRFHLKPLSRENARD